ncbi:BgTH12-03585 [Blumeria graminis f. sp. triticale]|uniref:Bgt-2912 n=2 Tax=Blumeria graminis TaxID=34373 RepID=A0A9X9L8C6_BLUGR|nr:BgTH12-03585 [Blumeria graminis f. sp. triticale]VCU39630.1 Bgt-2912 [Blumeria graminis f. sp. tritici]
MTSSNKTSTAVTAARRKTFKGMLILKMSPKYLQRFKPSSTPDEESTSREISVSSKVESTSTSSNPEITPYSNSQTPVQPGSPNSLMPPPSESNKKKGTKRSVAAALGTAGISQPKIRGKPGPKKKARLEDGTIDHSNATTRAPNGTLIKLGPKANQGAINAGLRALDRSGKPCRRWGKGNLKLKSFTGVCWEIPRWEAHHGVVAINVSGNTCVGDSRKPKKEISEVESEQSEKSNLAMDIEIGSTASHPTSSPPHRVSPGEVNDTPIQFSKVALST